MKKLIIIALFPFASLFADPVVTNMVHIGRTSIGYGRGSYPNGAESVSVGDNACRDSYRVHFSEFVGNYAGMLATNVRNCVAVGERALSGAYSCNNVIAIGTGTGQTMRYGTNVTMIGNHFFASEQANEMKISPYWCYSTNAPIWYKDGKMFLNATNGVYINRERYAGGGGGGGEDYVHKSGDTMTGELVVTGANLTVAAVTGDWRGPRGGDIQCAGLCAESGLLRISNTNRWSFPVRERREDPCLELTSDAGEPHIDMSCGHLGVTNRCDIYMTSGVLGHANNRNYYIRWPWYVEPEEETPSWSEGKFLLDVTAPSVISNTVNAGLHIERYVNMGGETEYVLMDGGTRIGKLTLEP